MAEQRVQRRLAAIMAADVVGYSRLIEVDEEGTRVRLRSLHAELIDPRIAADGGRIVKTMGDGILVEFPSAVDAVRNALEIQRLIHEEAHPDLAESLANLGQALRGLNRDAEAEALLREALVMRQELEDTEATLLVERVALERVGHA